MESFFQADLSGVRVFQGPAPQAIGALAFSLDDEVHFAPGLYDPSTREGAALLGHELTHVLQQRDGRVKNPFGHGIAIVQAPDLEAEADRMGRWITNEMWSGLQTKQARWNIDKKALHLATAVQPKAGAGRAEQRTPHPVMAARAKLVVPDRGSRPAHPAAGNPSRQIVQRMEDRRITTGDSSWCFNKGVRVLGPDEAQEAARKELIEYLGNSNLKDEGGPVDVAIVELRKGESPLIKGHPNTSVYFDNTNYLENYTGLSEMLLKEVDDVLRGSGEISILDEYWDKAPDLTFEVSLDYYHNRPLAKAKFHKDSLGTTMFINLAFANKDPVWGPEWIIDFDPETPTNSWTWEGVLPEKFQTDLARARVQWNNAEEGKKFKIRVKQVPRCGTVCFNDALVIHSTPLLESREVVDTYNQTQFDVTGVPYDLGLGTDKGSRPSRRLSMHLKDGREETSRITETTRSAPRSFLRHEVRLPHSNGT